MGKSTSKTIRRVMDLHVRLNPTEKQQVEAQAARHMVSVSEWARGVLVAAARDGLLRRVG